MTDPELLAALRAAGHTTEADALEAKLAAQPSPLATPQPSPSAAAQPSPTPGPPAAGDTSPTTSQATPDPAWTPTGIDRIAQGYADRQARP